MQFYSLRWSSSKECCMLLRTFHLPIGLSFINNSSTSSSSSNIKIGCSTWCFTLLRRIIWIDLVSKSEAVSSSLLKKSIFLRFCPLFLQTLSVHNLLFKVFCRRFPTENPLNLHKALHRGLIALNSSVCL